MSIYQLLKVAEANSWIVTRKTEAQMTLHRDGVLLTAFRTGASGTEYLGAARQGYVGQAAERLVDIYEALTR